MRTCPILTKPMESSSLAPSTPKRLSDTDENGTRCHKRQKAEDCVACLSNQGSFGLQEAQNAIVSMDIGIDGPTAEYEQSNSKKQALRDLLIFNVRRTANTASRIPHADVIAALGSVYGPWE